MRFLGLNITRQKSMNHVPSGGWRTILEAVSGNWQRNITVDRESVLANPYVFACQTLIARDIAKLPMRLMAKNGKVWAEKNSPTYSPVLRKPNRFQTSNQFWENWMLSKLSRGNTYVLKQRDQRNVVTALYVLDPNRVRPLVADNGDVYYELSQDNIAGVEDNIVVPAREVIHDRWNTLFHPLVGLSPIFANGVAATQGLNIQNNSAQFFGNQSRPSGVLTAPGKIADDTAKRLKEGWEANYSGENAGKVAVLGDGLAYQQLSMSADDSKLVEQQRLSAEAIAATYHVPLYKIGAGPIPTAGNVQTLNLQYYNECLQSLIQEAESALNEGLGLDGFTVKTDFDTDNLLRMDSKTQMETLAVGTGAGIIAPNEARQRVDLGPVEGGDTPYLQQQNYSLSALSKRDAQDDLWAKEKPEPLPAPEPDTETEERAFVAETLLSLRKAMEAA